MLGLLGVLVRRYSVLNIKANMSVSKKLVKFKFRSVIIMIS